MPIRIPKVSLKNTQFSSLFPSQKNSENLLPGPPKKHPKSSLESPINVFCGNMVFAIHSMRKPCFESSNCQQFHPKIDANSYLETSSEKTKNLTHWAQQTVKKGSQNQPKSAKITKNLVLGPHVSFHGPLGCPQAGKMVLRAGKWRHHACQTISFGHQKC